MSLPARGLVVLAFVLAAPAPSARAQAAQDPAGDAWLRRRWAQDDLEKLASAARRRRDESGAWPDDCLSAAAAVLSPSPRTDPWGAPYACRRDGDELVVSSAGPDGRPGTDDDLSLRASSAPRTRDDAARAAAPDAPRAAVPPPPPATPEEAATAQSLAWIGQALESHRRKEGRYPVTDRAEHLERFLVSEHLAAAAWTAADAWGRPLRYRTTDVGSSYTLASAGSDGRWEPVPPPDAPAEGADLVIADGKPVRWPAALVAAESPARAADSRSSGSGAAAAEPEPADPAEATLRRMERLGRLIESRRSGGAWPEGDDAERLARELGGPGADAWGRPLHYLSADAGRRHALVSAGPDGRLAQPMEAYARGAAAAGDDLVRAR